MTNDVSTIVTGIQGRPVSSNAPDDGYVLTWDDGNAEWKPLPIPASTPTGLRKDYFTSNGTWVCPAGVTSILVIAAGGGAGGQGGQQAQGGIGGGAAIQQSSYVSVTPSTSYTVTIGTGGSGGSGVSGGNAGAGTNGSSTNLKNGATTIFSARGGRGTVEANSSDKYAIAAGGHRDTNGRPLDGNSNYLDMYSPGTNGGWSGACGSGEVPGGSGGGAGPQGNGANGGAYNVGGNGGNGSSASANTGAGGGGGSGVCSGSGFTGGTGGTGGSGYMYIIY